MTRLVLLHGSVTNAALTWRKQQALAAEFELVAPDRPGFPPGPPVARVDFEAEVPWLEALVRPGDHLVGQSYGGVIALLAAPRLPLASLTVIEPPAFGVARGDPAVEALARAGVGAPARRPAHLRRGVPRARRRAAAAPRSAPAGAAAGRGGVPDRAMARRRRVIPLAPLPYPVLVVTGDHEPAFEAVGDVLERELRAERLVLRGAGHAVQNARGFNDRLLEFLRRAP